MAVAVCLLGEVAARVDGRPVELGPPRQRCTLAALTVEADHVVPVDRLVERVWGVDAPPRARATLHSYISRLRQALANVDSVSIVRRSGGYALTTDPAQPVVDLHRFRELCARARTEADDTRTAQLLTEALGMWRGEALTGLDSEWADAERERLSQERLAAQHDLVDARLRLGQGGDLVVELSARATEHPLDERVAGQYMLALHRARRAAEAMEHYRLLRARLVEELGTEPTAALQDLHQQILAADPALTAVPASSAVAPVVPRQLPAAPAPFVGRRDELDRLDAALGSASTGDTVVISALAGAGGIGKTWLALHWAHQHADRFPDGQLFVDLRGFSPDGAPMDPAVAVRGFLHALGVEPDRVPTDLQARTGLFRTLVASKQMLFVLDNAADTAQVTPLLPGSGTCTVLVTSRTMLTGLITGHSACHLPLDVLSDTEARALLVDRLGTERVAAEPAAVDQVIALCGGFPLALVIVSAHAHTRPHLPLAALADELHDLGLSALDGDDPAASLPTVLSWSHRALTDREATAFALLGIAPGPDISPRAAAALTGLSPNDTRALLRDLERASLISQDARGRYRMHDLVRRYAAEAARDMPEAPTDAALRRVVDFYLHTAHACERLLAPNREPVQLDPPAPGTHLHPPVERAAAMAWLDSEHQCLLAAQQLTVQRGWHHSTWRFAWALNTFLQLCLLHRDWLDVWHNAWKASDHVADPVMPALARRYLGLAHASLGRTREGIRHLQEALALVEHHSDPLDQGHMYRPLARAFDQQGDQQQALEHAIHGLHLYRQVGNPAWEAAGLNSVGWHAAQLGRYDQARDWCREALALHQDLDSPSERANTLDSLGYIERHSGNYEEAIDHYHRALALYRALGNRLGLVDPLDGLGHSFAALGQHEQARAAWQEALELYRQQGGDQDAQRVQRLLDSLDQSTQ